METDYGFVKLTTEPIEIEYVEDEHNEENDFKASFWFRNRRYFVKDFTQVHDNPWIGNAVQFPEYIHAVEEGNYYCPLYIEVVDGGSAVNVYE